MCALLQMSVGLKAEEAPECDSAQTDHRQERTVQLAGAALAILLTRQDRAGDYFE